MDRFIAALDALHRKLDLPDAASLAPRLERCLVAVRDGELPDRGVVRGNVTYQQHGIGFALWWPGFMIDVDVDRAYEPPGPRRLVLDPWKVATCGRRLGLDADPAEAEAHLHELTKQRVCDWSGEQFLWPPDP